MNGAPSGVAAQVTPGPGDGAQLAVTVTGAPGAVAGQLQVTATGPPSAGTGPPLAIPFQVRGEYDVRATGIDVQQAVQATTQSRGPVTTPAAQTQV